MKKLTILFAVLPLLFAACTEENLPEEDFAIIIDSEHCTVEGSFVQGSSLNEYCKVFIPYSQAKGGESVSLKSEKVNGIEIAQQTAMLSGSDGVMVATITGTPVALESTFLPVSISLQNKTYIVGVEVPIASDPNPDGEVVFTMDDSSIVNMNGVTERTFTVSPTMTSVVPSNIPAGLLVAVTQDLELGSGTITCTPLASLLSGSVTFTATFGARPIQQKNILVTVFSNGDGSIGNPYEVNSPELLAKMSAEAGLTSAFRLIDDITVDNTWTPVGTAANPFMGVLDGNGSTITLNINTPSTDDVALFAYLGDEAKVSDVAFAGSAVGRTNVAALAAHSESSHITGVTSNAVTTGFNNIAQLVADGTGKDASVLSFGTVPSVINIMAGQLSATEKLGITPSGASVTFNPDNTGTTISYDNTTDDVTVTKPNLTNDGFTPGDISFTVKLSGTGPGANVNSTARTINVQSMAMFESGTGVSGDPYIVINAAQLAMTIATYPTAYIALGNAVNLSAWETVASFAGNLDGQRYAATGLTKTFITTLTGTIEKIKFTEVNITTNAAFGTIVRTASGTSTITEIAVTGQINSSNTSDILGGIAGEITNTAEISNCYVNLNITASCGMVGGVVGRLMSGSTAAIIRDCTVEGSISITAAKTRVAGIVGRGEGAGTITNCLSTMTIDVTNTGANGFGGIFGANNNDNLYIEECMFTGSLRSGNDVGGIAGVGPRVKNCMVSGATITNAVSGGNGQAGGICGTGKIYTDHCIVTNATINGTTAIAARPAAGITSFYQSSGKTTNSVVIATTIKAAATSRISGAAVGANPLENNYATADVILKDASDVTVSPANVGVTAQDGETAPSTTDQAWYETLGYDFTSVWAWDAANNRPKLQNVGCPETVKP
jgi:hypothetical protein